MRLKSFEIRQSGPIQRVAVEDIANVVVFAGPNGVDKTSLSNAILAIAREPQGREPSWLLIEATSERERVEWGKDYLDTRVPHDAQLLHTSLRRSRRRDKYEGSFLNFDSDRAIRNVQPFNFSWGITDPRFEELDWGMGFNRMSDRFNDVRHSLFRLVESQKREIAEEAIRRQGEGQAIMNLDFPDVLRPYKEAFSRLLAPKELTEVNVQHQQIYYTHGNQKLSLDQLSSGEREVVNIVFDFILRSPQHSIIIFDEPELHLHPELSYKMLQTLAEVGSSNQFLFATHSPEIISASLENTVVFVTPPKEAGVNQAIIVGRDDTTHHALQMLGQSVGIISLGKKIVLIEGNESSLDKLAYGAILQNRFPEFVLVPVGGKGLLTSFDDVRASILNRTIWGVSFFLLCDRDALSGFGPAATSTLDVRQLKTLPRYHLENYFLDSDVIANAFSGMEPEDSWLRDSVQVDAKLREIAKSIVPYATALSINAVVRERAGNIAIMPKTLDALQDPVKLAEAIVAKAEAELQRVHASVDLGVLEKEALDEHKRLIDLFDRESDDWKKDIPGRPILNIFCSKAGIQTGRFKQLYLRAAKGHRTFDDIETIFSGFREASS